MGVNVVMTLITNPQPFYKEVYVQFFFVNQGDYVASFAVIFIVIIYFYFQHTVKLLSLMHQFSHLINCRVPNPHYSLHCEED